MITVVKGRVKMEAVGFIPHIGFFVPVKRLGDFGLLIQIYERLFKCMRNVRHFQLR